VRLEAIVLVYAADATLRALVADVAKKVLGMEGCTLCDITHGATGERSAWKRCKAELGVPVETWHQDDAPRDVREAAGERWPVVLGRIDGRLEVLVDAQGIARCAKDPDALARAIRAALDR
jgi:hypothetical protein